MNDIHLTDLHSILPALSLIVGGFAVVAAGTLVRPEKRQTVSEFLCYFALAFALATVFFRLAAPSLNSTDPVRAALEGFHGSVRLDDLALFMTLTVIAATGLTVVLSADTMKGLESAQGEYYGLLLLAAAGMMVLVEAMELITFFIALEVLSLALYALSGLLRRDARSNEAAIKYFVMGAFASGFLLYGMALLYGATGSISIPQIGAQIAAGAIPEKAQSLVPLGFVLFAIGLAFKVGVVPFHQWVPDVYEGAPTSVTAFMSVAVKAAGFGVLLRLLLTAGRPEAETWGTLLWALSILTLVVGNLLAIGQSNVKRMLAYSSVAHTGYILAGVTSLRGAGASVAQMQDAGAAAIYYLFVYTFMTLGAFAFLIYAGRGDKDAEEIGDFAGLAKRKPWAALAMTVFMVSLAGVPPTAGFFGKFLLFKAMVSAEEYTLVIVGVLSSAVSLYYYLRVVVYMYMKPEGEGAEAPRLGFNSALVVFACALFTLALGLLPAKYLSLSYQSIHSLLR
ncbi:MAG TPA: NADH-quinone oxidoreductase subunit N [Planctomycetota bacterium]|nr:NADH-quinone oxidoreductase subunit N [Planctomycetota bacterium]